MCYAWSFSFSCWLDAAPVSSRMEGCPLQGTVNQTWAEDSELMPPTPACNHGMTQICVSSCPPVRPLPGGLMSLSPAQLHRGLLLIREDASGHLSQCAIDWPLCPERTSPGQLQDESDGLLSLLLQSDLPTLHTHQHHHPWLRGDFSLKACFTSQSFVMSYPQEQLLPLTPTRLEIASLCRKFKPTPFQATMDDDLLLISISEYHHLL